MLPRAPRTHGIAVFGSGPDYNRREKEKRTANKAISFNCKSPLSLLLLMSDKPEKILSRIFELKYFILCSLSENIGSRGMR